MPTTQLLNAGTASFPWISVKDAPYGAAGNGVTDDTATIQKAINDAYTAGKSVFFPAGTYLTGPLTVQPQAVLWGVTGSAYLSSVTGMISRLLLKGGSSSPLISPNDGGAIPATGVKIFNLMLDTNNVAQSAIYLADQGSSVGRYWLIEQCLIVNSGFSSGSQGDHVYIGNLNTACTMRDCSMLSNAAGITTQNSHGWNGISWYGQDGLLENTFIGCHANTGLSILGGSNDQTFTVRGGGVFWSNTGIGVGGSGPIIDGVSVDHNYNDGIYVGYACTITNCAFHSNSLQTNNVWSHIRIANPVFVTIVGNKQAAQDGDAGGNLASYFYSVANQAAVVSAYGNYQDPTATLGTGWTNYAGTITAPGFPSSTVAVTNTTGGDVQAFITNGTSAITVVTLGSTVTGMQIAANGCGNLRIPNGQSVKFTYAGGAPSWTWVVG